MIHNINIKYTNNNNWFTLAICIFHKSISWNNLDPYINSLLFLGFHSHHKSICIFLVAYVFCWDFGVSSRTSTPVISAGMLKRFVDCINISGLLTTSTGILNKIIQKAVYTNKADMNELDFLLQTFHSFTAILR